MSKFRLMFAALALVWLACPAIAPAQNSGQADQTGGATGNQAGAPDDAVGLDADAVFSEIERDAVGSTGNSGRGFSDSSVAPPDQAGGNLTPGGIGGGLGGFGGVGGFGGFGQMFEGASGNQQESNRPLIRTRLRSAVSVRPTAPTEIARTATMRLQTRYSRPSLRGVTVTMQGRTAVLWGNVESDSDRRMSELLVSMEPGVSRVDNRITVSQ